MKKLEFLEMESLVGGKLTQREIDDFLGAASCTAIFMGGGFWTALSCANWINTL